MFLNSVQEFFPELPLEDCDDDDEVFEGDNQPRPSKKKPHLSLIY